MEIQPMKALGAGDVLELPDGQSVKLDKAVSVGGQLKVKYTGKPFKQDMFRYENTKSNR